VLAALLLLNFVTQTIRPEDLACLGWLSAFNEPNECYLLVALQKSTHQIASCSQLTKNLIPEGVSHSIAANNSMQME
jgi:hypothetical protein